MQLELGREQRSWRSKLDLARLTIHEAHELLQSRQVSSVELARAVQQRIHQVDGKVKAYLTLTGEQALKQAEAADRSLAEGKAGQVLLHQSSGHEILDKAALQTVKTWRFSPAKRFGQPVTQWFLVPIRFSLEDNEA